VERSKVTVSIMLPMGHQFQLGHEQVNEAPGALGAQCRVTVTEGEMQPAGDGRRPDRQGTRHSAWRREPHMTQRAHVVAERRRVVEPAQV
jgi:hypothetical protein